MVKKTTKLRYCCDCEGYFKTTRKHTKYCYCCRIDRNPKLKSIRDIENEAQNMHRMFRLL